MSQKTSGYPKFTREMRETHTILLPMMLPIHFSMLQCIFEQEGYHAELLTNTIPAGAPIASIGTT